MNESVTVTSGSVGRRTRFVSFQMVAFGTAEDATPGRVEHRVSPTRTRRRWNRIGTGRSQRDSDGFGRDTEERNQEPLNSSSSSSGSPDDWPTIIIIH